ncbi:ATP-dependent helicase [Alkalinema pantanalense CENA528]|uniref:ATP-dependent helicase n=1 Tax=Alkalinema pantanalense TaxID=1620705 RepID=UPI003D6F0A67
MAIVNSVDALPTPTLDMLHQLRDRLRPGQREIADWQGGQLAVSAVPGAGKSTGMAVAAAIAIARHQLHSRKQLVVVTFTRSAAANLKGKIRGYLKELNLPMGGFTVNTLHGLAWSIARGYPELSGLAPDAVLLTTNQGHRLIRNSVEQWITHHPSLYQRLLEGQSFDSEETERLRRQSVLRTEVLPALADTVIKEAKKSGLQPQDLFTLGEQAQDEYAVLTIAAGLYEQYQTLLKQRNWMDYEEMILGALRVLDDPLVRDRWQSQVFAVFEDEAQDSSPLQTKLLDILAGPSQNLIRVGDPNQAINSTFTPADPIFFRKFCEDCAEADRLAEMTQAGRSSAIILDAANFVLQWVNHQAALSQRSQEEIDPSAKLPSPHPLLSRLADQPFRPQLIQPVATNDPQPNANPDPEGAGLEIHQPTDIFESVERIGQRIVELLEKNPETSVAVLVRTNDQGRFVVRELRRWHGEELRIFEVGERDRKSQIPGEMLGLLQFLDRPHSPDNLKAALSVLVDRRLIPPQDLNALITAPEQFLYPLALDPEQTPPVQSASRYCRSLLQARQQLPLYQIIPFLAYTLDYDQTELATADKLAERLSQQMQENTLEEMLNVLGEIVSSEAFEPVDAEESDDRYTRGGQVTVITMHKAKGLDWDAVFMPFLHENVIPGRVWVPPAANFLGNFTLSEVARAQIRACIHGEPLPDLPSAWERAASLKMAEEFRLLYVAMTRAKRLLWMSAAEKAPFAWSKPDRLDDRPACPVIPALLRKFPHCAIDAADF